MKNLSILKHRLLVWQTEILTTTNSWCTLLMCTKYLFQRTVVQSRHCVDCETSSGQCCNYEWCCYVEENICMFELQGVWVWWIHYSWGKQTFLNNCKWNISSAFLWPFSLNQVLNQSNVFLFHSLVSPQNTFN